MYRPKTQDYQFILEGMNYDLFHSFVPGLLHQWLHLHTIVTHQAVHVNQENEGCHIAYCVSWL